MSEAIFSRNGRWVFSVMDGKVSVSRRTRHEARESLRLYNLGTPEADIEHAVKCLRAAEALPSVDPETSEMLKDAGLTVVYDEKESAREVPGK